MEPVWDAYSTPTRTPIPVLTEHEFQPKPNADSSANRTAIPVITEQPFQSKSNRDSRAKRTRKGALVGQKGVVEYAVSLLKIRGTAHVEESFIHEENSGNITFKMGMSLQLSRDSRKCWSK
jgi:hypothetical protein